MTESLEVLINKIKKQTESFDTVILNEGEATALIAGLEAAEHRIAELEAREVKLPPTFWYEHDDLPREIPALSRRLVINALREAGVKIAAGIGVKGE